MLYKHKYTNSHIEGDYEKINTLMEYRYDII